MSQSNDKPPLLPKKSEIYPLSNDNAKRESRLNTLQITRAADWFEDSLWTLQKRLDEAVRWKRNLETETRPEHLPSHFMEWDYREELRYNSEHLPRVTLCQRAVHFFKDVLIPLKLGESVPEWMLAGLRMALFAVVHGVEEFAPGESALHLRRAISSLVGLWDGSGFQFSDEEKWRDHVRETLQNVEKTTVEVRDAVANKEAELIEEVEKRGRMAARELKQEIREKTRDAKLAAIDQTGKTILKETRQEKRRRKVAEGAMQIAPQYRGTENLKGLRRKQVRAVIDYVQENPIVENDKAGKAMTDLTLGRVVEIVWAENEAKWENGLGGYPTYAALANACYRLDKSNREAFRYKG